jgi:protein-tyrosine phosphatase
MNRSALVVGRVLMAQGMTADEAIALVRDRRKGSLSDEYAEWLRSETNEPKRRSDTSRQAGSRRKRR